MRFCTPGMLIVAHRLLLENPAPTAEAIREAIGSNICRCTGYQDIVTSVLAAARARGPAAPRPADRPPRLVGARIPGSKTGCFCSGAGRSWTT